MKLLFWIVLSFLPGFLGRKFQPGEWYTTLPKAPWTPPPLTFPIVWTSLYLLIGVAAWLTFREGFSSRRWQLIFFIAHLIFNGLWSWIFFGEHQVGWALLDLSLLWIAAFAMLISFWSVSSLAGGLLVPYLIWLSIAFSLNGYIWLKTN